jgi:hypothetical protein
MPTRGRGRAGRGRGRGRDGPATVGSTAPGSQGTDEGQSSRGRRIVRPRSASLQTRRTCRRQANADAGPSERRPRVMIRGDQIYVGRTHLNPKILQHPLMALRPVMPLRTIVDQILMERWKERQRHSCGMRMTRMKQCKEKAMQSQATHLTRASRHHQVQIETGSNGN